MAPVRSVEEENVGPVARREPAYVSQAEDVRGVGRAGAEGLGGGEAEAGTGQVHHQRQRLAEGASGVEVCGQCDDRALLGQKTGQLEEAEAFL